MASFLPGYAAGIAGEKCRCSYAAKLDIIKKNECIHRQIDKPNDYSNLSRACTLRIN